MSAMSDVHYDIQVAISEGEYTFQEIATLFGVTVQDVELINEEMCDQLDCDDGDDGYALASAGYGCDEDYVCDNDYFDDY